MAFEAKEGSGALFVNDKKDSSKQPDYTGYLVHNGERINISAWKEKKGKKVANLKVFEGTKGQNNTPSHKQDDSDSPF